MAHFSYKATDSAGRLKSGTLEAGDRGALVERLRAMGYYPVNVAEAAGPAAPAASCKQLFERAPGKTLAAFTLELKSLLEAGLPLDRSLLILAELEGNGRFKAVIADVYRSIHGGSSFAEGLERHPGVFPHIYVSIVRAGEAAGALETMLSRLSRFLDDSQRLKDELQSALIYPAILALAGGSAVLFMLLFIIPKFSAVFKDMGGAMPLPTAILLGLSGFIGDWWWAIALILLGSSGAAYLKLKTGAGRARLDALKIRIPLVGPVLRMAVISRFSRTLGTLLQGGLPVVEALTIAIETMGNRAVEADMASVVEGVRRGRGLSAPLREAPSFPPLASHMLSVGEETGRIDEMLLRLADNYDREINTAIKRLLSLLEPVIILLMAAVVGFIVVSLLLAIFSMNDMPI